MIIIGLDGAGKTVRWLHASTGATSVLIAMQTLLEKIKTLYNDVPGLSPDKIAPTVGQNSMHATLFTASTILSVFLQWAKFPFPLPS